MTYGEILKQFEAKFPNSNYVDYRPTGLFTPTKHGLTIWLKNGDVVEYYPADKEEKEIKND